MTTTRLNALATEVGSWFTRDKRTDGTEYWHTKDGHPEWVQEMCHAAHGDMLPDDWRYAFIVEALDALSEADDPDDVSLEADVYTHELTGWLASRVDRYGYCDEYMSDFGVEKYPGMSALLQGGQYMEKAEVLSAVRSFLETRLEETADTPDEDDD